MIGENLKLQGEHLVDVFMNLPTADESKNKYQEIMKQILDEFQSNLSVHFTKTEFIKRAHECKTQKEVEDLRYDVVPDDTYQVLADKLNVIESLTDTQRLFMLARLGDQITLSVRQWTNTVLKQRIQTILTTSKSKIIT